MKKRIIIIAAICLIVLCCFSRKSVSANANIEKDFEYVVDDNEVALIEYKGNSKEIKIPKQIEGKNVTEIANCCFLGNKTIRKIWIPNTVTNIGNSVFHDCTSLEFISLPASLKCLEFTPISSWSGLKYWDDNGESPFLGCDKLKIIKCDKANKNYMAKDNVLYSKDGTQLIAVGDGYSKEVLRVPDGVELFYEGAIGYNHHIKKIYIPDSVMNMYGAIGTAYALKEIKVSPANPAYGSCDGVLYDRLFTEIMKVPSQKTGSFTVSNDVKEIWCDAFCYSKLSHIYIPDTVRLISYSCFSYMKKLTSIRLCPGSPVDDSYNDCQFYDSGLKKLEIPEGVTDMSASVCMYCKQLKEIVIPASVNTITYFSDSDADEESEQEQDVIFCEGCTDLERITVKEGNKDFKSVDGVLYDRKMKKLMAYPCAKKDTKYTVTNKVSIEDGAFYGLKYLRYIKFKKGIKLKEEFEPFVKCENLQVELTDDSDISSACGNFFKNCKNCKLLVHKNSKIQKQAKKYKIPYEIMK